MSASIDASPMRLCEPAAATTFSSIMIEPRSSAPNSSATWPIFIPWVTQLEDGSGVQAVAYATYEGTGEAATAQAVRFGQVLNALVAKIPTYSDSVQAYLNQLGLIPDPSLPVSKLSPILAALAAQQSAGRVTVATLPLTSSDALNDSAAAKIVSTLLGGTAKAGASAGQAARVLVQNGTGASTSTSAQLMAVAQAKLARVT